MPYRTLSSTVRGLLCCSAFCLATVTNAPRAEATFHFWSIEQIYYTNSTGGTVQFLELKNTSLSPQSVDGRQIQVTDIGDSQIHTLTLPSNLPAIGAGQDFVLGTAGLDAAGGPTPNFIMPDDFLFTSEISINLFGGINGPYYPYSSSSLLANSILPSPQSQVSTTSSTQNSASPISSAFSATNSWQDFAAPYRSAISAADSSEAFAAPYRSAFSSTSSSQDFATPIRNPFSPAFGSQDFAAPVGNAFSAGNHSHVFAAPVGNAVSATNHAQNSAAPMSTAFSSVSSSQGLAAPMGTAFSAASSSQSLAAPMGNAFPAASSAQDFAPQIVISPEPTSFVLLACGGLGVLYVLLRRRAT